MLGISYGDRTAVFRVFGAFACPMFFYSPREIVRDAGIETAVRAFHDIDDPRHADDSIVCQALAGDSIVEIERASACEVDCIRVMVDLQKRASAQVFRGRRLGT